MAIQPHDAKHLTLQLGVEEYAIPVRDVREIVGVLPPTPVPGACPHLLGVVNLRGKVVPLIELRRRLGLPSIETGPRAAIVVCQVGAGPLVGLLVDRVNEVAIVRAANVSPPPASVGREVAGLARLRERVVVLLDIAAVIDLERHGRAA